MTLGRFGLIVGAALVVMVINVAVFYLWVVIYSYVIDRGHDHAHYQEYAQRTAPYSSMIVGFPLMIIAGWLIGGRWEAGFALSAAVTLWATYTVIDVAIVGASKPSATLWKQAAVSQAIKLAGVLVGVWLTRS